MQWLIFAADEPVTPAAGAALAGRVPFVTNEERAGHERRKD
jgi:hypothetical protein